ncbi:MAG: hypothetical protein M1814_002626 [Vezdaea aestivalis]|nr:MAG: hypothetical protein M1814_002626 [Vezdaea aestivalis]
MNGFASHGVDESHFDEKQTFGEGLRTFDAFREFCPRFYVGSKDSALSKRGPRYLVFRRSSRTGYSPITLCELLNLNYFKLTFAPHLAKTKTDYTIRNARGGQWTVLLLASCLLLTLTELVRWSHGSQTQHFSVEKGVGHQLQINFDMVINMRCDDVHINVQDAAGDRIMAGDLLKRDRTSWAQWADARGVHKLGRDSKGRVDTGEGDEEIHVHDVMALAGRRGFQKTPRIKGDGRACRLYGNLDLNKVQGDFHITARGHGYMHFGDHLDHNDFNFSHIVNELSFGPFYPSLNNPLDRTIATTAAHFYQFQYYLSIVPTIYRQARSSLSTNQYAATEQSSEVDERGIPGVFFKFDIEPILLTVSEERSSFLGLLVRLVNVVSGVLVGGGWCYQLIEWASETRRKRSRSFSGVLSGKAGLNGHHD